MDRIEIHQLEVEAIIGVRPHERRRPQRVLVDVELGLELAGAGRSGRLTDTCDYDIVAQQVSELIRFRRYALMETAAEELAAMLFAVQPAVEWVALRITKPAALESRAGGAAVRVKRQRTAYLPREVELEGARLRVWIETQDATLQTVTIPARSPFDPPREWIDANRLQEVWLLGGNVRIREQHVDLDETLVRLGPIRGGLSSEDGAELFVCLTAPAE